MAEIKKKSMSAAVQLLAIASLCAVSFHAGARLGAPTPDGKYLVADKNAVILSAVMERDSTDAEALKAEIIQPIVRVMRQYTNQGYVIIDGGMDEHGNFAIAALPPGTRDITKELAAAVARKESRK